MGHKHGCLDAPCYHLGIFSGVQKEASLHFAEDLALAGRGGILSESAVAQLLPVESDEHVRRTLYMLFKLARQALFLLM